MSTPRWDRTLRAVMWLDAFGSVTLVVICVVGTPVVAAVGLPESVHRVFGLAVIACAAALAACGAITALLLFVRMRDGDYRLPRGLRLPLPPPMRPEL